MVAFNVKLQDWELKAIFCIFITSMIKPSQRKPLHITLWTGFKFKEGLHNEIEINIALGYLHSMHWSIFMLEDFKEKVIFYSCLKSEFSTFSLQG